MDAGFPHRDQPPARLPADHAAGGRGRPNRGEINDGESGRWPGGGGTLIPHAAADAVGALAVAVVEAPFQTPLMPSPGSPHRAAAAERPARRRAVGSAAVTRRADGKQAAAMSAGLLAELAERDVHGVGARGASSDWTTRSNRGTTAPTGSLCRSTGRSRGSGGHTEPSPHVSARCLRYPNEALPASSGACGRRHSCGRKQPRPHQHLQPSARLHGRDATERGERPPVDRRRRRGRRRRGARHASVAGRRSRRARRGTVRFVKSAVASAVRTLRPPERQLAVPCFSPSKPDQRVAWGAICGTARWCKRNGVKCSTSSVTRRSHCSSVIAFPSSAPQLVSA